MANDTNFRAQRRNLILVSTALTVFYAGGGEIKGLAAPPLGMVELKNPDVVLRVAWLTWLYALWRFYLFSSSTVKAIKDTHRSTLGNVINGTWRGYLDSLFDREVRESCKTELQQYLLKRRYAWLHREGFAWTVAWWPARPDVREMTDFAGYRAKHELPLLAGVRIVMRAYLSTIFNNTQPSDLLLPYLIAIAPVIACVYRHAPEISSFLTQLS